MKKRFLLPATVLLSVASAQAQVEPAAGTWKTWFIPSGRAYRLAPPPSYRGELAQVLARQQTLTDADRQRIAYWNAGAPGYRWQSLLYTLWMSDPGDHGILAYLLLGVATHDATVAAWDTKYAHHRRRPFAADGRVKALAPKPESPSYPCEHSVAAGVAVTLVAKFYPALADSARRMAEEVMASRVAAGVAFPSDTRAGFELGKRIAEAEMEQTADFVNRVAWDGKVPQGPGFWRGKRPASPTAGLNKTVVLTSGRQFRPGPPPDFARDMAELKAYKPKFGAKANAFFFASQSFWEELLHQKIFEHNLHLNPPRAARLYAAAAVGYYDGFVACWDAKYAYWGIRPDQLDTTYHALLPTPPFPGYPSGHAAIGSVMAELYAHFFPAERAYFQKRAKDGAESRFQGGIHFRTDNEVGLDLGRKVAGAIVERVKADGADEAAGPNRQKTALAKTRK